MQQSFVIASNLSRHQLLAVLSNDLVDKFSPIAVCNLKPQFESNMDTATESMC